MSARIEKVRSPWASTALEAQLVYRPMSSEALDQLECRRRANLPGGSRQPARDAASGETTVWQLER